MKIVKGWKRISNKGGFVNEVTGQTLIIAKQEFGEHYHVLLFKQERTDECARQQNFSRVFQRS